MKKNKGITLISLIITIIVMLILVAVSVNVLIKSNLIGTAEKAVDKYKTASEEEANGGTIEINGKKYASIEDYIEGTEAITEVHNWERTGDNLTCKHCNRTVTIGQELDYKDNGKGTSKISGNMSGVSQGITDENLTAEDFGTNGEQTIEGGLVIYDIPEADLENAGEDFWTKTTIVGTESYPTVQCDYNQFVWVPVETPFVTKAELDKIIADSNGSITTEREAMQSLADSGKYPMAVELANGTDYRGVLYGFSEGTNKVNITVMNFSTESNYDDGSVTYNREPAKLSSTSSSYVNQTEEPNLDLQNEYNNIVKSVKEQKGFWAARYELSYNTKGESKRGKTVANAGDAATQYWYGLYNACKTIYEANNKNEIQSNMIYGSQWDQIMIWMKDVKNTNDSSKYYILDSSYMGNYKTTSGGTGTLKVSGYKNEYSVKQIFDLGGNFLDWTTEACNAYYRILRGGWSYYSGSADARIYRMQEGSSSFPVMANGVFSARAALYVSL